MAIMSGSVGLDNVLRKKKFRLKLDVYALFLKLASQLYTPLNKLHFEFSDYNNLDIDTDDDNNPVSI